MKNVSPYVDVKWFSVWICYKLSVQWEEKRYTLSSYISDTYYIIPKLYILKLLYCFINSCTSNGVILIFTLDLFYTNDLGFFQFHNHPFLWLTFWHRSFTFNSNKSPTWCNNFSVCYPDVCLHLNMFRAFSRPSSGAQWLQRQPLALPSYRGESRAVFVVGPGGPTTIRR
jgi:hypothetical protein